MIKVIIDRDIDFGQEKPYALAAQEMLQKVLMFPGYISSERLFDINNKNHRVIITSWESLEDWQHWFSSLERSQALENFSALLKEPEKIIILQH